MSVYDATPGRAAEFPATDAQRNSMVSELQSTHDNAVAEYNAVPSRSCDETQQRDQILNSLKNKIADLLALTFAE